MSELASWLVLAGIVVAIVLLLAWRLATRLDGLHRQVLQARASLDTLLVRRAHEAMQLATSDLLDPASALLLAQAASEALDASGTLADDGFSPRERYTLTRPDPTHTSTPRAAAESRLTQVLRVILSADVREEIEAHESGRTLFFQLMRANQQVAYARRFHNDHVSRCRQLRSQIIVRALHLAGRAAMPDTVDIDDVLNV
ncbi:MAG: hypothetical protein Q4B10_07760 [Actinomycetaceae bacterium]|nr:hypothetical protein [Actinomycetaceae bacterium]